MIDLVTENDNVLHRASRKEGVDDPRIYETDCGVTVARFDNRCPPWPEHWAKVDHFTTCRHLTAMPGCKMHAAPTRCPKYQ